jgi:hypothetical protein
MADRAQLPLPGDLAPGRRLARRHRRGSYARVWSDPAVLQAEADAERRFEDWRDALVRALRRLPPRRRAALRRRIGNFPDVGDSRPGHHRSEEPKGKS